MDQDVPVIDTCFQDLTDDDIEELALSVRKKWGLADNPIQDLIGVLENHGIIVTRFAINELCSFKGVDAFSSWKDGTPYILYHSVPKSAVRTRFSLLHELGHLIMHSAVTIEESMKRNIVDLADEQADRFAAAFLLPCTSFPEDVYKTSLSSLEYVKQKWGAALSTIIYRCADLELFSENQINYLKRQMTMKKYWRNEPLDDVLTIASPEMLRDAVFLLIENNIVTRSSFLNAFCLSFEDLKCICELPDSFFERFDQRKKPDLKILYSTDSTG